MKMWKSSSYGYCGGQGLLDDYQSCIIKGKRDIKLKVSGGSIRILNEVRYIPNMKRNLISLGILVARGFLLGPQNVSCKFVRSIKFYRGS